MRVNTVTGKLHLLRKEWDRLEQAFFICKALMKHADGELQDKAKIVNDALAEILVLTNDDGDLPE